MARPRKTTGNARAVVEGELLPPKEALDWDKLEDALNFRLGSDLRNMIWLHSRSYVTHIRVDEAGQTRAELIGREGKQATSLSRLHSSLRAFLKAWKEADEDEQAAIVVAEVDTKLPNIDVSAVHSDLEIIFRGLEYTMEDIRSDVMETGDNFAMWAQAVAEILKSAGCPVTKRGDGTHSPFQAFMFELNSQIGDPIDTQSKAAFGRRIIRAMGDI